MSKYIIGIDPGLNGGIVVLDNHYKVVSKQVMPVLGKSSKEYDIHAIRDLLLEYSDNCFAILEKSQPRYRDGKKQAFKTGFGFGVLRALLIAFRIPLQIVSPQVWQKRVFKGVNADDTKTASVLFCRQNWPDEDWTPTERSKKYHDGLTDAACIAYFGGIEQCSNI